VHLVLHLHRLDDAEHLTRLDLLPLLDLDREDVFMLTPTVKASGGLTLLRLRTVADIWRTPELAQTQIGRCGGLAVAPADRQARRHPRGASATSGVPVPGWAARIVEENGRELAESFLSAARNGDWRAAEALMNRI
jgi:hypothetical protein